MRAFLLQLRSELKKLFARRRTYIGYGAFIVLELVVLWVFHLDKPREEMARILKSNGLEVDHYYSSLTVTYWMIILSMGVLGGIYLALVSGDIVAKESEDATMKHQSEFAELNEMCSRLEQSLKEKEREACRCWCHHGKPAGCPRVQRVASDPFTVGPSRLRR